MKLSAWFTTPQKLTMLVYLIWAASITFGSAGVISAIAAKFASASILSREIPSISFAREIEAELAELDRAAADEFLTSSLTSGPNNEKLYTEKQRTLVNQLIVLANDAAPGSSELDGIKELFFNMQGYFAIVERARVFQERHRPEAIATFLSASQLMHARLMLCANTIASKKVQLLTGDFPRLRDEFSLWSNWTVVSGWALVIALIGLQIYLRVKTNRLCNPLLFTATIVCLCSLVMFMYWARESVHTNELAKNEIYEHLNELWAARSAANQCDWYESLYLLNKAARAEYLSGFHTNSDRVNHFCQKQNNKIAINAWCAYLDIDRRILVLENQGAHGDAIQLCLGTDNGQSEALFKKFHDYLAQKVDDQRKLLAILEVEGLKRTTMFMYLLPATSAITAAFAWQGMRPRLKEYGG